MPFARRRGYHRDDANAIRTAGWLLVAIGVLLVGGLGVMQALARTAEAHATLIRSNPANQEQLQRAPLRVTLNFSEEIERRLTKIEVTNTDGERVDDGEIAFDDDDPKFASVGLGELDPGLYTVEYSNVSSVDGHPWGGLFEFIILNPDGSVPPDAEFTGASESGTDALPEPIDAILKWTAMTALAIVAGVGLFLLAVYRPAGRFLDDEPYANTIDSGERWVVNVAHVLLPIAFIASALLIVITVSRFETSTSLWDYLTSVRAGQYRGIQLLMIAVTLVGADLLFLARSRRLRDAGTWVMIVGGFAALLFYPLVSHAASDTGKFWSLSSDYTHISASAVWLGMLVMLPPVLRLRLDEPAERFLFQANVFDRFSILAGLSVFAVLTTGVFNALVAIPDWDAMWSTTYGRVLIIKLAVVAGLLAVAGLNAFILKPRLVAAIDTRYQGRDLPDGLEPTPELTRLQRWLPRTIIAEIVLVVAVFGAVGVLTQTTSARSEVAAEQAREQAAATFEETFEEDGLEMTLIIRPNLVGRNEYEVVLRQPDGSPYENATQVRLRFIYDSATGSLQRGELQLNERGAGIFRGEAAFFDQPGNWRIETGVRRSDGDDINRTVVITLQRPLTTEESGGAFELPFDSFTWNEVAGVAMILLGVLAVMYRQPLRALEGRAHTVAMGLAVVLMIGGGILAFGVDNHGEANNPREGNPVAPTEASIDRGRVLYEQNCVVCHGVDGRGDGPQAESLNPRPSDYRLHVPYHTDVELFRFIADGYPGTAMPAWREDFSEEDIWNLVNFLRANFGEGETE